MSQDCEQRLPNSQQPLENFDDENPKKSLKETGSQPKSKCSTQDNDEKAKSTEKEDETPSTYVKPSLFKGTKAIQKTAAKPGQVKRTMKAAAPTDSQESFGLEENKDT